MYYTRQKFLVDGEEKELKIPLLDIDRSFVEDSDNLFPKNFRGFDNIKVTGIYKGEIISPFPDYYPSRPMTNVILPLIEPKQGDIDVTSIIGLFLKCLRVAGAPLFFRDDVEYSEDEGKFKFTRSEDNLYFNRYMNIIDVETESEEDDNDEEGETVSGFTLEKDTIRTSKFLEFGIPSDISFQNILSYNIKLLKFKYQRLGNSEAFVNAVKASLSEPYIFSVGKLLQAINQSKLTISGISDEGLCRLKCGENAKIGGFLEPNKPFLFSTSAPILRLIESYFKYLRYIEDRIFIDFSDKEIVGTADVTDIYVKSKGIPYEPRAMVKEDDELLVPLLSFSEIQEIIKDVNQTITIEKANGRSGLKEELIMLESLDATLEITQDKFAFPYKRKEQFSMDYKEPGVLTDEEIKEVEGYDENNDAPLYDNEEVVSTNLMILLKNLLYEESNKSMTEDEYFEYCVENNISSQNFIRYMAVACSQIANITWAHTGLIPVKPRTYWYTEKGWEYRVRTGKVSLQETLRYDDNKSITDEESNACHLFTPNRFGRMGLGSNTGSVFRIPIMGDFKILRALEEASKEDILAPISVFIRFCRWGSRKPSKIKIGPNMYFQPYNGDTTEFRNKGEENKPDLAEGVDGILTDILVCNSHFTKDNPYGFPEGSYELPIGVAYKVPYQEGESESHIVDLITLVTKGLNLKGLTENNNSIEKLAVQDVLSVPELIRETDNYVREVSESCDLDEDLMRDLVYFLFFRLSQFNFEEGSLEDTEEMISYLKSTTSDVTNGEFQRSMTMACSTLIYKKNPNDMKSFMNKAIEESSNNTMTGLINLISFIRDKNLSYKPKESGTSIDAMINSATENPFDDTAVSSSFANMTFQKVEEETVEVESVPEVVEVKKVQEEPVESVQEPVESDIKTGEFSDIPGKGSDVVISEPVKEDKDYAETAVTDVDFLVESHKEEKDKSEYIDGLGRADINDLFEEGGLVEETPEEQEVIVSQNDEELKRKLEELSNKVAQLEKSNSELLTSNNKLKEDNNNLVQVKEKLSTDNAKLKEINSKLADKNRSMEESLASAGTNQKQPSLDIRGIQKDGRYTELYFINDGKRILHVLGGKNGDTPEFCITGVTGYSKEESTEVKHRKLYGTELRIGVKNINTLSSILMGSILGNIKLYFSNEEAVNVFKDMLSSSDNNLNNNQLIKEYKANGEYRQNLLNNRERSEELIRVLLRACGVPFK